MEWNTILFALLVLFIVVRMMPARGVKHISTVELKKEIGNIDKQFVDVRTPAEYKGRNIKEFINIPLHKLNQELSKLDKNKEVIVICQSGMRSNKASKLLKKNGFKKVTNVKGGMSAWRM
ncbi:rhodanese [Lottiidibacillus patelloidae]|uniref:Rhodanese n=1 Tax=Lottiidibacillus patelloidae TaxID=2670334 RepID=A0A263BWU6_9BACI|nr:rhodanese-like domain-containing protein [Lottiidibacillus patelloidae]OZM58048.1 rhodanese [Lottiidibacillus patelloidae]